MTVYHSFNLIPRCYSWLFLPVLTDSGLFALGLGTFCRNLKNGKNQQETAEMTVLMTLRRNGRYMPIYPGLEQE